MSTHVNKKHKSDEGSRNAHEVEETKRKLTLLWQTLIDNDPEEWYQKLQELWAKEPDIPVNDRSIRLRDGSNPLDFVMKKRGEEQLKAAHFLLDRGMDPLCSQSDTLLERAVRSNSVSIVERLVAQFKVPTFTPQYECEVLHNVRTVEMAELLWKHTPTQHRQEFINSTSDGANVLHSWFDPSDVFLYDDDEEETEKATRDPALFRWLVYHGIDVWAQNKHHQTVFQIFEENDEGKVLLQWLKQALSSGIRFVADTPVDNNGDITLKLVITRGGDNIDSNNINNNNNHNSNNNNNDNSSSNKSDNNIDISDSSGDNNSDSNKLDIPLSFRLNRNTLSSRCPKFAALFHSNMREAHNGVVEIPVAPQQHYPFSLMVTFLMTGKVDNAMTDPELLVQLAALADEYLVESLKDICENSLIFHLQQTLGDKEGKPLKFVAPDVATHVINLLCAADRCNLAMLKEDCLDKISRDLRAYSSQPEFFEHVISNPALMKAIMESWNSNPSVFMAYVRKQFQE